MTVILYLAAGTINVDILAVELERIAEPEEVIYLDREIKIQVCGHTVNAAIDIVKLGFDPKEVGVAASVGKGFSENYVTDTIKNYRTQTLL